MWDLSLPGGSLVSSFQFESVVNHLGWDSLERFFIGATNDSVQKVNLYRKSQQIGYDWTETLGGGGRGDVSLVTDQTRYNSRQTITALHLSKYSQTVVIGTDQSAIQILALPSLLPTRIINPQPTSPSAASYPTFLATTTRPSSTDSHSRLSSDSNPSTGELVLLSSGLGRVIRSPEWATNGGQKGRTSQLKLSTTQDLRRLISLPGAGVGVAVDPVESSRKEVGVDPGGAVVGLEEELGRVRAQLAKAVSLNEAMWQKVVHAGLEQS